MLCGVAGAVLAIVSVGCTGSNVGMNTNEQRKPFVRPLPDTQEYVRLLAKPESVGLHSGLVTLQPGEDCGWHSTEDYEEMIVCLAGSGEVETEGNGRRTLAAGQYAYNPLTCGTAFSTPARNPCATSTSWRPSNLSKGTPPNWSCLVFGWGVAHSFVVHAVWVVSFSFWRNSATSFSRRLTVLSGRASGRRRRLGGACRGWGWRAGQGRFSPSGRYWSRRLWHPPWRCRRCGYGRPRRPGRPW